MLKQLRVFNNYRILSLQGRTTCEVRAISNNSECSLENEDIENAIRSVPGLASTPFDLWYKSHEAFINHGLNTKSFIEIISKYPSLLTKNPMKISDAIEAWRSCQFGEKQMSELLTKYPILLNIDNYNRVLQKQASLRVYVSTTRNVWKLLMNSPNLLAEDESTIKEIFDYLQNEMRIDVPEILKSSVFSRSIEDIKTRHIFLERLGIFKPRSLKAEPNLPSNNPKLYQIMDTDDNYFATKVAKVTLPEYETFQELYRREMLNLQDAEDDSDDD